MLFYMSEEGQEGRNAFVEHRQPDFFEVSQASMSEAPGPLRRWVLAARPRTLPRRWCRSSWASRSFDRARSTG